MKYLSSLGLSLILMTATTTSAQAPKDPGLKPYRAVYVASYRYLPFKGKAVRELRQLGENQWLLSDKVSSTFLDVLEESRFLWHDGIPIPQRYFYKLDGFANKREEVVEFDWEQSTALSTYKGNSYELALRPGTQDRATYQLMLRHDLIESGTVGTYPMASRRNVRDLTFEVVGHERLDTKLGSFETVKIARQRDPDDDRETLVWLATEWDYLLLKLSQVEGGQTYEILLEEAEIDGQPMRGE